MSDKTVKFNVGGQVYEVSQSILDMHPDSMLAKSASKLWKKESDIFIESDGARFRFVLDYMRHGKVTLPVMESKETVMAELKYFGIEAREENINDTSARRIICRSAILDMINALEVEYHVKRIVTLCLRNAFSAGIWSSPSFSFQIKGDDYQSIRMVRCGHKVLKEKVNACLECVGLKLSKIELANNAESCYLYMVEV